MISAPLEQSSLAPCDAACGFFDSGTLSSVWILSLIECLRVRLVTLPPQDEVYWLVRAAVLRGLT